MNEKFVELNVGWIILIIKSYIFTGVYCQTNINNCDLMLPCDNNATCINMADGYKCECRSGFVGVNCSTNINDCDPDPCLHDGRCVDGENDYQCECTPGFKGQLMLFNL